MKEWVASVDDVECAMEFHPSEIDILDIGEEPLPALTIRLDSMAVDEASLESTPGTCAPMQDCEKSCAAHRSVPVEIEFEIGEGSVACVGGAREFTEPAFEGDLGVLCDFDAPPIQLLQNWISLEPGWNITRSWLELWATESSEPQLRVVMDVMNSDRSIGFFWSAFQCAKEE